EAARRCPPPRYRSVYLPQEGPSASCRMGAGEADAEISGQCRLSLPSRAGACLGKATSRAPAENWKRPCKSIPLRISKSKSRKRCNRPARLFLNAITVSYWECFAESLRSPFFYTQPSLPTGCSSEGRTEAV